MTREQKLRQFLDEWQGSSVKVGADDCGPWVALWIARATGLQFKFAAYQTRQRGLLAVQRAGGMVALVEPQMVALGLSVAFEPVLGDVGVLQLSDREVAAIAVRGEIWAVRNEAAGYHFLQSRHVLRAWSLPG